MPKAKCPQCATVVAYSAGYDPICPQCGFRGPAPAAPPQPAARWAPYPGLAAPAPAPVHAPPPPQYGESYAAPQQGLAVAALVCGIAALFIPFIGVVAAVLGGVALGNADREPQRYGGKGMAVTGLVLGIVFSLFWFMTLGFRSMWDDSWWWDW